MTQTAEAPARPAAIQRKQAQPQAGSTLSEAEQEVLAKIEQTIEQTQLAQGDATGKVAKAFAMAQGIGVLRELITDEMMARHIMPLMNTRLGFKTDKDPSRPSSKGTPTPYAIVTVKECLIEALLRGANPVGNEFNIISAQAYFTREFFERALGELPGVTNVVASPGVPQNTNGKTLIRFGLSWKVNGVPDCLRDADGKPGRVFEIKADAYSGSDQIVGKATRKAYAAAYKQIIGSDLAPPDGDATEAPPMVDGSIVNGSGGADRLNQALAGKPVTSKPVSEGQAFEPGPDAQQQVANQQGDTAKAGETVNTDTGEVVGAQQQDAPAASAAEGAPEAGPDLTSWELVLEACRGAAQDAGMSEADLLTRVNLYVIGLGVKGKEAKMRMGDRRRLVDAIAGKRLLADGKITPKEG